MAYFKLFRELWRYAGADRWKIALAVVFHVLSLISNILQPLIFAQILNVLQLQPEHLMRHVVFWIGLWVVSFLWFNLFHRSARYLDFDVAYRVKQRFLNTTYGITTRLPLQWHGDHHSGDTINRINKAAEALSEFGESHSEYIAYFMLFWGPLIGLATLSWEVSLASFIVALCTIVVIKRFDRQMAVLRGEVNEIQHRIAAVLYDYIGNMKTIVTLRLGAQTEREVDQRLELGYRPYMRAEALMNAGKWFTVSFCVVLLEAGVILFYISRRLAQGSGILAGNIAAVFQYLQQLSGTFFGIAAKYQTVVGWWVDYQAILPLCEALPDHIAIATQSAGSWQSISLAGLDFSYTPDKPTLRDITLSFAPGDRIALVGESGSGKSSLMAVLRGLYEPSRVALNIDGRRFDSLAPLSAITTLIPQEPEIFENTIRYNITFGVEHSDAEVRDAIRLVRFDAVLERLPNGLDTDMRERGVTLSGGERQRLALARGILAARDSAIILLDEPTSSVDVSNEAAIYGNLFGLFADRVVISSIHRLHLLSQFTHVIVMEEGRIVESGTFEALRNADGPFQALWRKSQSELN